MRSVLACMLLSPIVAFGEPIEALKPMAFLAGHCWKGEFPDGKQTDEHCFQWVYDGKALRDVHTVRAPGRPDYVGESIYYWDSVAKRVEYLYIENLGGVSRGSMEPTAGALVFPSTQFVADGQTMTYRARWTLAGNDEYDVLSEVQGKNGWTTLVKLTMKRRSL